MSTSDFGFFILSDETSPQSGLVAIILDHDALLSMGDDDWDCLLINEKDFVLWYREKFSANSLLPGMRCVVDSSIIDNYNQDSLCAEIMKIVKSVE